MRDSGNAKRPPERVVVLIGDLCGRKKKVDRPPVDSGEVVEVERVNPPFPKFALRDPRLDDEVGNKTGIYSFVLDGEERRLNIRTFSEAMKREAYERQKGVCVKCGKKFPLDEMEGDHIKPWHESGKTLAANCQMLCRDDNRRKSGK